MDLACQKNFCLEVRVVFALINFECFGINCMRLHICIDHGGVLALSYLSDRQIGYALI